MLDSKANASFGIKINNIQTDHNSNGHNRILFVY